jgi:hypothetical protein
MKMYLIERVVHFKVRQEGVVVALCSILMLDDVPIKVNGSATTF